MTTAELLAELEHLGQRPDTEAVARLVAALEAAESAPDGETVEVGLAVVGASGYTRVLDEVLARVRPGAVLRLLECLADALESSEAAPDTRLRGLAWDALDWLRRPALLRRIPAEERNRWADATLSLVDASRFTVGPLFRHRAQRLGSKRLFQWQEGSRRRSLTWRRAAARVELLARGLVGLGAEGNSGPVAILSENRIELALLDLACLTSGLVNVLVPAHATDDDVGFILRHCGARTAIVSTGSQLRKVIKNREALPLLERIVTMDPHLAKREDVLPFEAIADAAEQVEPATVRERGAALSTADVATVMYTSGTTGTPKGIQFSHRNIVFKRFARALALPEIGEDDVFLCFLPLFHTFGRFLEMMGCVFWAAKYCMLGSTSADSLVSGMRTWRPTVFISVPKKWIQLYEQIGQRVNLVDGTDEEQLAATRMVTGGNLRFGLSAAGHLDSEIFRFFQRQGVELVSGFGMTEATGGITMTEPGNYRDGSLGPPLPGIRSRLAEDGELLVQGPYVMVGYLDPPDGEPSFDEQGWFHTGDLMEIDGEGHLRLIDRKKEIYKNVQGETIAPQRVENLFRDFESVGRAFLVGDHREYNTLLLYPNPDYDERDLSALSRQELNDHFRSLVVSVNQFLAPYERIVDFAVIDRDLDIDRGELTPKGTPRRKVVEQNFAERIAPLYRRANPRVGGVELTFPNWLLQILGLTAGDIRSEEHGLTLPSSGAHLTVRRCSSTTAEIGSCVYRHGERSLNLGALLTTPRLWLGNEELVSFVPLDSVTRQRNDRDRASVEWAGRIQPYRTPDEDRKTLESHKSRVAELDLLDMDLPARMLGAADEWDAMQAVSLLEAIVKAEGSPMAETARILLRRSPELPSPSVRRCAFQVLIPAEKPARFKGLLRRFLRADPGILDAETRGALSEQDLSDAKLRTFIEVTREACTDEAGGVEQTRLAESLLDFLTDYGAAHPIRYRRLRAFFERMRLFASRPELQQLAAAAGERLREGFHNWLGPTALIAVDPETGGEYRWDDVVVFDDAVPETDRRRILSAIKRTRLLKEGVFLFSTGANVRLSDIPPGGVWIRLLGSRHGKSVYRITVQTRFQGAYDLAVNVNHALGAEQIAEEIQWLILSGISPKRASLVEDFGGYWPDQDLWSEEFIPGETLMRSMRRLSRDPAQADRFQQLWSFFAWATLSAYVDFWDRSGRRLEVADPDMTNIIVPTEDYQSGARIVSLSRRRPHRGVLDMLSTFRDDFIKPAERLYPGLQGRVGWNVVFSSVLEVVGESAGLDLFREALEREGADSEREVVEELGRYIENVVAQGYVPMRLHFAVERYRRWSALSEHPTPQARALTLQEIYDTYRLEKFVEAYPEIRVRFFLETVFRGCAPDLAGGLRQTIQQIRDGELVPEDLILAVDELRAGIAPGADDEYFLARLSYPYLRPEDAAGFVRGQFGGRHQSEIVVTLADHDGILFRVRHAQNPKEVERLHRLFLAAKLDVRFRMEHQYLVALNERSQIIGGIYYEIDEESQAAHLEKIVVADRFRRKGVADGLMTQLFNRLRAAGVDTVTTGFFRPEYFYGYGFRIGKRYAGLVKSLEERESDPARDSPPA